MRKYENGVKVRVLIDFEPELENYERVQIEAGTILTLLHSNKYRTITNLRVTEKLGINHHS